MNMQLKRLSLQIVASMLRMLQRNRVCKMNRHIILRHATSCSTLKHMKGFFMKNVADALRMLHLLQICGALAELVYALVLGTSVFGHESSSLLRPTKPYKLKVFFPFTFFKKLVSANLCLIVYTKNLACRRYICLLDI